MDEYDQAVQGADELCKRLGKDWRPNVWENLGWFFAAVSLCGRLKVYRHGQEFSAYLGEVDSLGSRWIGEGSTPKSAVKNAVGQGKAEVDQAQAILKGL